MGYLEEIKQINIEIDKKTKEREILNTSLVRMRKRIARIQYENKPKLVMNRRMKDILIYSSESYGVSMESLVSENSKQSEAKARWLSVKLLREYGGYTYEFIALLLNRVCHGSAMYSYKRANEEYKDSKDFRDKYNEYVLLNNN